MSAVSQHRWGKTFLSARMIRAVALRQSPVANALQERCSIETGLRPAEHRRVGTKNRNRVAVLGDDAPAKACIAELGPDADIVLSTEDPSAILELSERGGLDEAALCNPEAGLAAQLDLAATLLDRGVGVHILRPAIPHGIEGLGLVRRRIDGQPLVFLPARHISPKLPLLKRMLDVFFSAVVLLIGSPFWLVIAMLVKVHDWGPVFFVQNRVGSRGRLFPFVKFRTMWPDAAKHHDWYEQRHGQEGQQFKLRDDPRRTPVGRLLRRFSLDEVPQFLHSLAGQMSLVGPRPPLPSEVARYRRWQRMRLDGWFGLTGLWQVCGRSEIADLDDIVLLDALYLRNHSLALDLRIILRTVRVVIIGRGAF